MRPDSTRPAGLSHVSLRVRDVQASAAFYYDLLGLEPHAANPPRSGVQICSAGAFGVVLTQGLSADADLSGVDHFAFSLTSPDDVNSVHQHARQMGARTTQPRVYDGFYQTFVFDPDGYKVELLAPAPNAANHPEGAVSDDVSPDGSRAMRESWIGSRNPDVRCGQAAGLLAGV